MLDLELHTLWFPLYSPPEVLGRTDVNLTIRPLLSYRSRGHV